MADDQAASKAGGGDNSQESAKQRVNRELIELLNEIRVALPGVQVLFAFLLILPFQERWPSITDVERVAYYIAVLATVTASILLIAPGPYHRIRFRDEDKFDLVRFGNRMLLSASAFLAIAIVSSFYLVSAVVLESQLAGMVAALAGVFVFTFWYAIPVYERQKDRNRRDASGSDPHPGDR
jgi:hypothetical protein